MERSAWARGLPVVLVAAVSVVAVLIASLGLYGVFRADELADSAQRERLVARDVSDLWETVLAMAASGVGAEVAGPADVLAALGAASANQPGASGRSVEARVNRSLLSSAQDRHRSFIKAVSVISRGDDFGPLELGSELGRLEHLYIGAREAQVAYVDALAGKADESRTKAIVLLGAGAVLLLGVHMTGLLLSRRVRRIGAERLLSEMESMAGTVERFSDGDFDARTSTGTGAASAMGIRFNSALDGLADSMTELADSAAWSKRSQMISEALEQVTDEQSAYRVIQRALAMIDEEHHPVELSMTSRGSGQLRSVATDPTVDGPDIPEEVLGTCAAVRRGRLSVFESSQSINACPMLTGPGDEPRSGVCVPVTVAGRPVGVFHMLGPEFDPPPETVVERLVSLAIQLGTRLGALRTLESTRRDAETDGLTGLPNRRRLENAVSVLIERGTPFVMVMADLDKFKKLNDTYGHEVGDKALQLFAGVLKENVRGNDLVARIGGEEFVLVYPEMSLQTSVEAVDRLRQALARAVNASTVPVFTCSFGITGSDEAFDGDAILRIADAGLLKAKELGGDQAVVADMELARSVFHNHDKHPESGADT